jgi:hypothetical protein
MWNLVFVIIIIIIIITIQRDNIRPSKKEMNKTVTTLKLPDFCS